MSNHAIRVEGLSKSFRLGHKLNSYRFTEFISNIAKSVSKVPARWMKSTGKASSGESDTFWALQDVSFEVQRGEAVGFIGRNGAGKSTLLKLLSRIMYPTRGRIEIRGRVRSLLEVGTGFHQDLTGRENIFLNGAVLGMSQKEIRAKFDEIVAFSEVERFLDTPVKYYSSGMYVRLAFAVAAHLDPEILIVDEVLAVGDGAFQKKCLGKMGAASRQGKTVLIVSHHLNVITNLCQRAVLLDGGRVSMIGTATDVAKHYMESMQSAAGEVVWNSPETAPGNDMVRLRSVRILQPGLNGPAGEVDIAKELLVQITYWNLIPDQQLYTALSVKDNYGTFVMISANVKTVSLTDDPWYGVPQPAGIYESTCTIPADFFNNVRYHLSVIIGRVPGRPIIVEDSIISFDVHDTGTMNTELFGDWSGPILRPRLPWQTTRQPGDPPQVQSSPANADRLS